MIKKINTDLIINELNKSESLSGINKNLDSHHSHKWDFLKCQKHKTLNEIDTLLQKAMKIANKRSNEIGEEGWFVILEFLSDYANSMNDTFEKNV
jgi:hypothetical protein